MKKNDNINDFPESELQDWILTQINENNLYNVIKEDQKHIKNTGIEVFSIDFLLYNRYQKSAKIVYESLQSNSTLIDNRNISLEKNEILKPDFVLIEDSYGKIIIVELKTSKKTEREAMTELFAYAQEIRNHLPFISNYELLFVIISNEYTTLLEHSIANLLLGTSINILCLKAKKEQDKHFNLVFHSISTWSDVGDNFSNSHTFLSLNLHFNVPQEPKEPVLDTVIDLITHEASQNNSHGFCFLWKDTWKDQISDYEYAVSLFCINPYVFIDNAIKIGFLEKNSSNISKFLYEKAPIVFSTDNLFKICKNAYTYLKHYCSPSIEEAPPWNIAINHNKNILTNRSIPILFNAWGFIGDYIKTVYISDEFKNIRYPAAYLRNVSYKSPIISLPLIYEITDNSLFKHGDFYASAVFKFGKLLSIFDYILKNINYLKKNKIALQNLEALIEWIYIELSSPIFEIGYYYNNKKKSENPPPVFIYNSINEIEKSIEMTQKYILWFNNEFIGSSNSNHQYLFLLGINNGFIFNDYISNSLSINNNEILCQAKKNIITYFNDFWKTIEKKTSLQNCEDFIYKLMENNIDYYESNNFQNKSEDEKILDIFEIYFLNYIDNNFGSISSEPFDYISIIKQMNIHSIKQKMQNHKKQGRLNMSIVVSSNGEVHIGFIPPQMNAPLLKDVAVIVVSGNILLRFDHCWSDFL